MTIEWLDEEDEEIVELLKEMEGKEVELLNQGGAMLHEFHGCILRKIDTRFSHWKRLAVSISILEELFSVYLAIALRRSEPFGLQTDIQKWIEIHRETLLKAYEKEGEKISKEKS